MWMQLNLPAVQMFRIPFLHAAQAKAPVRKSAGVGPQTRFPANLSRPRASSAGHQSPPLPPPRGQTDRLPGLGASSGGSCWTESSAQAQPWIPEHVSPRRCHQAQKSRRTSALFINQRMLKAGTRIHSLSTTICLPKNGRNLQSSHQRDCHAMGTTGGCFNQMNDVRFGLN